MCAMMFLPQGVWASSSVSALCPQTRRAWVWPWLSSAALTARFNFYPACTYLMFCDVCQNLQGWKWMLMKTWLSIKIWSRAQTLQCLLLFFHFPVSLVKLMHWVIIWDACSCNGLCLHLGRETGMSDEPGAVNQRLVEDNLCATGSCMLLKLE